MVYCTPGDVKINGLVITSKGGALDVTHLMQIMEVYEDITLPGINVELVLLDDRDLQDILPLVGSETLIVNYESPGLGSFVHTFALTAMHDENPAPNLKTKAYRLVGVAMEVIRHKTSLVDKSYRTQYSAMVQDIFQTYLQSGNSLEVEQTKGIQHYTVTNKKPFVSIKDILSRSVSDSHESSSYVFFENQQGFHFVTMEQLSGQGPHCTYSNYEVVNQSIFQLNFRNILGYKIPDAFKVAEKLGLGAFASKIQWYDHESLKYGFKIVQPNVQGMTRPQPDIMTQGPHTPGIHHFVPKDLRKPDTFLDEMIPKRAAYAAEMDQIRIIVRAFGDSTLTVGQTVDLQLMMTTGQTSTREPDRLLAGKYLVSKLNSIILPGDVRPMFTQVMELLGGGYASAP
jgi:hypothetical protein